MVTDDVKYFIGCLRVNDTTKYATCPELYAAFNNYCNRSELYTSITKSLTLLLNLDIMTLL